jgi:hypothetical protein
MQTVPRSVGSFYVNFAARDKIELAPNSGKKTQIPLRKDHFSKRCITSSEIDFQCFVSSDSENQQVQINPTIKDISKQLVSAQVLQ